MLGAHYNQIARSASTQHWGVAILRPCPPSPGLPTAVGRRPNRPTPVTLTVGSWQTDQPLLLSSPARRLLGAGAATELEGGCYAYRSHGGTTYVRYDADPTGTAGCLLRCVHETILERWLARGGRRRGARARPRRPVCRRGCSSDRYHVRPPRQRAGIRARVGRSSRLP